MLSGIITLFNPAEATNSRTLSAAYVLQAHIGSGVVAVQDHGFERRTRGDFANKIGRIEGRAVDGPDAGIERKLFSFEGLNDFGRVGLAQGLAENESLDCAADEQCLRGVQFRQELWLVVDSGRMNPDGYVSRQRLKSSTMAWGEVAC